MLPGTYTPTDPSEVQAFAMERARSSFPAYSSRLANLERQYLAVGMSYHFLPFEVREKVDDARVQMCLRCLTTPRDDIPEPCEGLRDLKSIREEAREALRRGDGVAVEDLLHMSRLDDFMNIIEALEMAARDMMDAWMTSDTPLGCSQDHREMMRFRRKWIMSIPFVADAVEQGFVDEEQAYRMVVDGWTNGEEGLEEEVLQRFDNECASVDSGEEG